MASENKVMKGVLEDHTGAAMHPETSGGQVIMADGRTAEETAAALLAALNKAIQDAGLTYLNVNTGGKVDGHIDVTGVVSSSDWGSFSAGTSGIAVLAQNAYIDRDSNAMRYKNTHGSLGARGLYLHPVNGLQWFDTGGGATTKDAEFSPVLRPLASVTARAMAVTDLNELSETGFFNGSNLVNAPGSGWFYILVMSHHFDSVSYRVQIAFDFEGNFAYYRTCNVKKWTPWKQFITGTGGTVNGTLDVIANGGDGLRIMGADHIYLPFFRGGLAAGRSAYLGYGNAQSNEFTINNEVANGTVHVMAAQGFWVNGMKVPNVFKSTAAPTPDQGADGDVWHQYV